MKKIASLATAFLLILSFALPQSLASAATDAVKVTVDGVELTGDVQAVGSEGEILIPIESFFKEAGFKVTTDKNGDMSVTNSYLTVDFNVSAGTIEVNGKKVDAPFPWSLKNYGHYVSAEFLNELEGFKAEVSEDKKSVTVTTNRLSEEEKKAVIEKMMNVEMNSFSTKMKLDQQVTTSSAPEEMDMDIDMNMDFSDNPFGMYMKQALKMNLAGEKEEIVTETYQTEEGTYQFDGEQWVKLDEGFSAEDLKELDLMMPSNQDLLKLMQPFMKGIHIFDYEDQYVMVQSLTTEEVKEMLNEAITLFEQFMIEAEAEVEADEATETTNEKTEAVEDKATKTTEENKKATEVEVTEVKEENKEVTEVKEEKVEAEVTEEVAETEEVEVDFEEDFKALIDSLNLTVNEFYFTTNYNKETLHPGNMSGALDLTIEIDGEKISLKQTFSGSISNINNVTEIKVPADVKKKAISAEEYFKQLEAKWEAEMKEVEKAEEAVEAEKTEENKEAKEAKEAEATKVENPDAA